MTNSQGAFLSVEVADVASTSHPQATFHQMEPHFIVIAA
jgi:hypothetical protein